MVYLLLLYNIHCLKKLYLFVREECVVMLKENEAIIAKNGRKLVAKRPDLSLKQPNSGNKRYFISLAKQISRPGIFETLGSYDLNTDDAELFGDDSYRRLMNLLIYRSLL